MSLYIKTKQFFISILKTKCSPLNLEKRPTAKNAVIYENYDFDGKNMPPCIKLTTAKLDWLIVKTSVCIAT